MPPEQPWPSSEAEGNGYARMIERRLALPVVAAALVSVPAVFLSMWAEGVWAQIGYWANVSAGMLLWAEWILLIILAENTRAWLRANRWSTFVAALTLPAVVFALGPAQVLRLVRAAGALRVMRITRVIEAGGVLRRRMGLKGWLGTLVLLFTVVPSVVFVIVVLANPESGTRRFLHSLPERFGAESLLATAAIALLATAAVVYLSKRPRAPRRENTETPNPAQGPP